MENHTSKHFVLQLGSLISLYLSVSFLIVLIFGLINLKFPDAAEGYWAIESASTSIRLGIAMVVVFFPTYIVLTRLVNLARRQDTSSAYLGLTKWLIYLSLLIGGAALLGDLVAVVMAFLEGELTVRFILKALAVLIVVGSAFYYYLLDARGFWLKEEKKSITYGIGMAVVVMTSLVYGFMNIETPDQVRQMRLDDQQVTDLQAIQYQIENYVTLNGELPKSLEELPAAGPLPVAAEEREPYTYELTDKGFRLCATFAEASGEDEFLTQIEYDEFGQPIKGGYNWSHSAGNYCFERVVDLEAFKKPAVAPIR